MKILRYKQFEAVGISPYTIALARQIHKDIADFKPKQKIEYNLKDYFKDTNMLFAFNLTVQYDPGAENSFCRLINDTISIIRKQEPKFSDPDWVKVNRKYLIVIKDRILTTITHEVNHLTDGRPSSDTAMSYRINKKNEKDNGILIFNDLVYACSKPEVKSVLTEVYIRLLLKNTTRSTFQGNLMLDEKYNLALYLKKIINDKMDDLLNSDDGRRYVHKWLETENTLKGKPSLPKLDTGWDIVKAIATTLKDSFLDTIGMYKGPMASPEQVDKFIKRQKHTCLKNIESLIRKCGKLYSLFENEPHNLKEFNDRDYADLVRSIKGFFGDSFTITDEESKQIIDRLKSGKSLSLKVDSAEKWIAQQQKAKEEKKD